MEGQEAVKGEPEGKKEKKKKKKHKKGSSDSEVSI